MSGRFYITTPIYYVNSHPHIGHAYTTIVADVIRRFRQYFGEDTYFLTGTDEHGQKIAESAKKEGISPQELTDRISQEFRTLWPQLNIEFDQFIRTTDAPHQKMVQEVLQQIYERGEIYMKEYEGLYCVGCEQFLDESELVEGNCPIHQKPPEPRKEQNYFFQMSKYHSWLLHEVETRTDWIYPSRYRNEILQFLQQPLQDLSISRPKSRLTWGIELPFDRNYVAYVWFDALLNYASALDWPHGEKYQHYWPHVHHLIGKDILKAHAIYWPCILKAANMEPFHKLLVHGHWVIGGSKMSKSLGNVVDPLAMKEVVGVDALRFFLTRDMSFGEDANFTEDLVLTRYHGDLANNIGNLLNRSIAMSRKNFDDQVPPCGSLSEEETQLQAQLQQGVAEIKTYIQNFYIHKALDQMMSLGRSVNKYIDTVAPWKLTKDPNDRERLGTILYTSLDSLRILTQLLAPVMPEKSEAMWQALGFQEKIRATPLNLSANQLISGQKLPKPIPLFPRIQPSKEVAPATKKTPTPKKEKQTESLPEITIEEFSKMQLTVGKILSSQKVEKADKLLHSQVDLGEAEPRSIVSGIAQFYSPEEIVGKLVVVVSNLKPVKLRGILSQGMILCTDDQQGLRLVEPPDVALGTIIR